MKLACPTCGYSEEVAPDKVHHGTRVTCPACGGVFTAGATPPITCPACGQEQEAGESCSRCGLIFRKYRAARERRQTDFPPVVTPDPAVFSLPISDTPYRFGHGRHEIMTWARGGQLAPELLPRAALLAGMLPGPARWRRFLEGLALWLGAIFLAAAVIFFFAYNWQALGRYARFGCIELLLVAAVAAAWRLGLDRTSGKAALLTATLLVGALQALVGQTYQTGADTWELFGSWALLVLPWLLVSRFPPLWLLWLALVNLTAILYFKTFGGLFGLLFTVEGLLWILSALNGAALVLWELAEEAGISWLGERWPPRVVATAATGSITLLVCWGIVHDSRSGVMESATYALFLAAGYAAYRRRRPDLYLLALGVLSLVVVSSVFLGHAMGPGGGGGAYLFIGMPVLGMSALGGWWLRGVGREVER